MEVATLTKELTIEVLFGMRRVADLQFSPPMIVKVICYSQSLLSHLSWYHSSALTLLLKAMQYFKMNKTYLNEGE